jgi:hypothetical protein
VPAEPLTLELALALRVLLPAAALLGAVPAAPAAWGAAVMGTDCMAAAGPALALGAATEGGDAPPPPQAATPSQATNAA